MPTPIEQVSDSNAVTARNGLRGAAPIIFDLIAPIILYYALRTFGVGQVPALLLSGVPTAVFALIQVFRSSHLDPLALFTLALLAGGTLAAFITGDIRVLLAKGSMISAATAVSFAISLHMRRPLTFTFARALLRRTPLSAQFHLDQWDNLWESDATFRHRWRVATAIWIVGLAASAAAHIALAYLLAVDLVPVTVAVVNALMFALIQLVQQIYLTRSRLWRDLLELDAGIPPATTGKIATNPINRRNPP